MLRIIRNRSAKKQTLGKVILVVTLERVLFSNVSENRDRLVQDHVNLDVCFLDSGSEQQINCKARCQPTPLRPFLRFSSINREINSGAFSLRLTKSSKACVVILAQEND